MAAAQTKPLAPFREQLTNTIGATLPMNSAPRKVIVIGANETAKHLAQATAEGLIQGIQIVGFIDLKRTHGYFADLPLLGSLNTEFFATLRNQDVDEIVVALHDEAERELAMKTLQYAPMPVHIAPNYLKLEHFLNHPTHFDALPLLTMRHEPLKWHQRLLKRAFDIIVSSLVLLLILPVFIAVAIAIRLDSPGGVFFLQTRVGKHGKTFKIYKFRSMVSGADRMVDKVKQVDSQGNTIHKVRNDFRVTRVGKIIRKTSLDELPQLINVIRGDMSLVGPRPEVLRIVDEEYDAWQYERFTVLQGITGWWQVTGRSDNPCHLSTDKDIYYIRNYSLWLDIKILFMTVPALLKGKGAF